MRAQGVTIGVMKVAKNKLSLYVNLGAWALVILVAVLAFVAWGQTYNWHIGGLHIYQIFPLLGLLAFSLMWTHYVVSIVRQYLQLPFETIKWWFETTSWAVLVLICLHPGLLMWQRYRDGFGLPPGSYLSYVVPSVRWITLLGTASLFIFLAYEFRRIFGKRPWWRYMQMAVDAAMLAIFYHSLRLGTQLNNGGWFRILWLLYGFVLVYILIYNYILKPVENKQASPQATMASSKSAAPHRTGKHK